MTKLSTYTNRWGISLIAIAGLALLLSLTSSASAQSRSAQVVVLEDAGAGTGPELAVQGLGGRVEREIPLIRGFSARVPRSAVRALRGTPGVLSVHADRRLTLRSSIDASLAPSTTLDTLRTAIGAETVRGGAADVALVDSGVSPAAHVVNGADFSEDSRVQELRYLDAFGHGTHLAGIIASVAPQSRVVNVKVADHDGSTSLGRVLAGIDWVVRRGDRDGLNVRVLNLAFGADSDGSYRNDPLAFAVERAWDRGLVVVASAGNGGHHSASLDSPAYDPYVIAVGAEDSGGTATLADDGIALFSSRGSFTRSPDVVAPGVAVLSTRVVGSFLDEAFPAGRIGDGFRGSGTSQAAAVVSGAAALVVGERPRLDPDQVKALLRSTARPLANTDESLQGAGVVNVLDATRSNPPRDARQRFLPARIGGWLRGGVNNQLAVENLKASRWSASRWSASRWSASRWSASRWSASRWSASRWSSLETGGGSS